MKKYLKHFGVYFLTVCIISGGFLLANYFDFAWWYVFIGSIGIGLYAADKIVGDPTKTY